MPCSADKRAIRSAFGAAATAYDSVASVQWRVARNLAADTPASRQILDAGSGTGAGARLLRTAQAESAIISLDAAHAMCVHSREALGICGDIEALPLRTGSIDLYWSSLAWQWTRPALAIAEAARVLAPGGHLRVATLGPATLQELRKAFATIDDASHVRDFEHPDIYAPLLAANGFVDISIKTAMEYIHAPDLHTLLCEIRTLGAHELGAARRRGMLGRTSWLRLQAAYESFREAVGLPVSYDVIYLHARRIK